MVDGVDEYEDTRLFIVSPPSFKLHPGKSKKVRLGFRGKRGTPSEQTFRLIVAEVPSEVKKAAEGTSTLDVTLRHVLPVYVAPQTPGGPKLSWTITNTPSIIMLGSLKMIMTANFAIGAARYQR